MVAQQQNPWSAAFGLRNQVVQDTPALGATIHEIAQMSHQRIQVAATVQPIPLDQLLDLAQEIESPVHVAHGVDADPSRQRGCPAGDRRLELRPAARALEQALQHWNAGLGTSSDMMNSSIRRLVSCCCNRATYAE